MLKELRISLILLSGMLVILQLLLLVTGRSGSLDIQLHDTYFVFSHWIIIWWLSLLLLFIFYCYRGNRFFFRDRSVNLVLGGISLVLALLHGVLGVLLLTYSTVIPFSVFFLFMASINLGAAVFVGNKLRQG